MVAVTTNLATNIQVNTIYHKSTMYKHAVIEYRKGLKLLWCLGKLGYWEGGARNSLPNSKCSYTYSIRVSQNGIRHLMLVRWGLVGMNRSSHCGMLVVTRVPQWHEFNQTPQSDTMGSRYLP